MVHDYNAWCCFLGLTNFVSPTLITTPTGLLVQLSTRWRTHIASKLEVWGYKYLVVFLLIYMFLPGQKSWYLTMANTTRVSLLLYPLLLAAFLLNCCYGISEVRKV